jgi:prophage DNA circulation protein
MTSAAADANPTSRNEAEDITRRVATQLDTALILAGDRGDDELYNALMQVRASFLSAMSSLSEGLSELMQINTAQPLPALTLANRLYQDVPRE